ncbi:hypothetical protein SAMD00023353_1001400 [Rosellinia necatrix]|uniref:Uncharacterized protein n=1 Tax=Rosellinia necatrix TaxID=77044 RepID=A0A1S8A7E1_ROSNE|nr:hypothetical protein SAMD00023353_1001400 [Rosellinia necatrix]
MTPNPSTSVDDWSPKVVCSRLTQTAPNEKGEEERSRSRILSTVHLAGRFTPRRSQAYRVAIPPHPSAKPWMRSHLRADVDARWLTLPVIINLHAGAIPKSC